MVEEQDYSLLSEHLSLARINAFSSHGVATAPTRWSIYDAPEYDVLGEFPATTRLTQGSVSDLLYKRAFA